MGNLTPAELAAYVKLLEDLCEAVSAMSCADELHPEFGDVLDFRASHNIQRRIT